MRNNVISSIHIIKGLMLVMLLYLSCCFWSETKTDRNSEKILYLVANDFCKRIWIMDIDGKNSRELFSDYTNRLLPGWTVSKDGKWLAFLKSNYPGTGYSSSIINLLNLHNLTVRQIEQEQPSLEVSYSWSPTSNQIIYPDFHDNLYVYDIDTDSKKLIFVGDSFSLSEYIRWSPNGTKIAGVHVGLVIYVFDLEHPKPVPIYDLLNHELFIDGLNWLTDEELLFYEYTGIHKLNIASRERSIINTLPTVDIAISPDKQMIAAMQKDASKSSGNVMNIYIMDKDGLKHKKLTDEGYNGDPCWSSDGRHIVFASSRDGHGEIYIMDTDGQNQKRLTFTSDGDSYNPVWVSQPQVDCVQYEGL